MGRSQNRQLLAKSSLEMLTAQQQQAVSCRDVSVGLSSGAGCGKTHVLTQRYLSHLEEGAEVGQVVAITFTDRAASPSRKGATGLAGCADRSSARG
jgi:superfamily I DNA/RNA helicase